MLFVDIILIHIVDRYMMHANIIMLYRIGSNHEFKIKLNLRFKCRLYIEQT